MKRALRSKLTYANVVSSVCLFLLVGGGAAFAATQLPKNSVTSKQIKQGSIQLSDLSPGARAVMTGAPGAQGATGLPGAPGSSPGPALAWAEVGSSGNVERSAGEVKVTKINPGEYCVSSAQLNISNAIAVATLDNSDAKTSSSANVFISNGTGFNNCPGGQWDVFTADSSGNSADHGFSFLAG